MTALTANEVGITFFALFLLLISAVLCGKLFELCKAPKVVGEIVGGMLLGGSLLKMLLPDFHNAVFNGYPEEGKVLNLFYQFGLILLMFTSGYNTSISLTKKNLPRYGLLFLGATIVPVLITFPFVGMFEKDFVGTANNHWAFVIVFLISAAITSIPVISKIFFDIDMMNTRFSNMVLTVSTIQDLCLWIFLNMAISLVQTGEFEVLSFCITTLITIGLFFVARLLSDFLTKKNLKIKSNQLPIVFLLTFGLVFILSKLNINIMYSSFISGYIAKALLAEDDKQVEKVKEVSFSLFIPIYFALVGIQIDVLHNFSWWRFMWFFIIVFGAEFIGTVLVMWFTKLKKCTVLSLGIAMNARGGPGIVLATTAYASGIINVEFFTVLILTTMLSSTIAGYWLYYFKNRIKDDA